VPLLLQVVAADDDGVLLLPLVLPTCTKYNDRDLMFILLNLCLLATETAKARRSFE